MDIVSHERKDDPWHTSNIKLHLKLCEPDDNAREPLLRMSGASIWLHQEVRVSTTAELWDE